MDQTALQYHNKLATAAERDAFKAGFLAGLRDDLPAQNEEAISLRSLDLAVQPQPLQGQVPRLLHVAHMLAPHLCPPDKDQFVARQLAEHVATYLIAEGTAVVRSVQDRQGYRTFHLTLPVLTSAKFDPGRFDWCFLSCEDVAAIAALRIHGAPLAHEPLPPTKEPT